MKKNKDSLNWVKILDRGGRYYHKAVGLNIYIEEGYTNFNVILSKWNVNVRDEVTGSLKDAKEVASIIYFAYKRIQELEAN